MAFRRPRPTASPNVTPLKGCEWCHKDHVCLLHGCLSVLSCPVPWPLQSSKTALHEAALSGHAEVVAELLRKGVDHDLALPVSEWHQEGMWACLGAVLG